MTIQQAAKALTKQLKDYPKFYLVQVSSDEKQLVVYLMSEPEVPFSKSFQDYPVRVEILPTQQPPVGPKEFVPEINLEQSPKEEKCDDSASS